MKKIKKLNKKRIISLFLLVCLITITLTFAIYRESISKLLNINVTHPSYTVTFDANGGSVSTASKSVTYKHQYGELPTPTKTGYQFDGWNGKNILDKSQAQFNEIKNESSTRLWVDTIFDNNWVINNLKPNTIYTISYDVECIDVPEYDTVVSSNYGFFIYGVTNKDYSYISMLPRKNLTTNEKVHILKTFTTLSNINDPTENFKIVGYTNRYLINNEAVHSTMKFSNIQIEEGDTATAYEPYYITSSTEVVQAQDHTLTAIWEKKEATFDTGQNFIAKIKQLAGNENATYETIDTNITSIQRANSVPSSWIVNDEITPPSTNNVVSTNDSKYPIYAWFDNGTIYYYTEALNPYININCNRMFNHLSNATSIDLSSINTSNVTNMSYMFYGCSSLTTLNVSNFNTQNVITMNRMFANCSSLTSIDISSFNTPKVTDIDSMFYNDINLQSITFGNNFDTSKVIYMGGMFWNCSSLTSLDLSHFDTSSVQYIHVMFCGCSSLTILDLSNFDLSSVIRKENMLLSMTSLTSLKTPNTYPSNLTIDLPKALYDVNGNAYTTLDSTSPTETWLRSPYTVTFNANGGSVSPSTQDVIYGLTYGTLPTPTKTGHTFVGWNGKNNFNYQEILSNNSTYVSQLDLNGISTISWINNSNALNQRFLKGYFDTNKQYTFYGKVATSIDQTMSITIVYTDASTETFTFEDIEHSLAVDSNGFYDIEFHSSSGKTIDYIRGEDSSDERMYIDINSFVIEEGTKSSEYEPYYVTSSTNVVQDKDHILKAIWEPTQYTVTFDANGGTVSKASKKVKDGDEYGTLPTPTRDGYTFKGWNGKNLFDKSKYSNISDFDNFNSTTSYHYAIIQLKPNTTYKISVIRHNGYDGTGAGYLLISDNNGINSNYTAIAHNQYPNQSFTNYLYTTGNDGELYIGKSASQSDLDNIWANTDVQIEESSTATPYEPYYITSSTEVVQAQNHTLKAIWEPNTYTVSFNKNDNSASGSMSNISMTYDVSSTLPSNSFTKTGYKFVGWNTKSDGTGTTYSDGATVSNLTTTNNATVTLYAQWKRVMANNVEYDEPEVNCNNVQCMIDELYDMLY